MISAAPGFTVSGQLCFALYSASRAVSSAYRKGLGRLGLTYPQYLVMLVLWEEGEVNLRALSERLNLDSGTLSPLLKRLERQGMVVRRRHLDDERILCVASTPAGDALYDPARQVQAEVEAATGLGRAELVDLREQLHRLAERTRSTMPLGAAG